MCAWGHFVHTGFCICLFQPIFTSTYSSAQWVSITNTHLMSCSGALTPFFTRTTQMLPSWVEHHQPMMRSSGSCSAVLKSGTITEINFLTVQWTSKKKHLSKLEKKFPHTQVFQIKKKKKEFVNICHFSLWLYFTEENFQNNFDFYWKTNIMNIFFNNFF